MKDKLLCKSSLSRLVNGMAVALLPLVAMQVWAQASPPLQLEQGVADTVQSLTPETSGEGAATTPGAVDQGYPAEQYPRDASSAMQRDRGARGPIRSEAMERERLNPSPTLKEETFLGTLQTLAPEIHTPERSRW